MHNKKARGAEAIGDAGGPVQATVVAAVFLLDRGAGVRPTLPGSLKSWLEGTISAGGGLFHWPGRDRLVGLWGLNTRREDDPERAVQCALAIRDRFREQKSGAKGAEVYHLRMALSTGPVVVLRDGEGRLDAGGDAVDTAFCLAENAPSDGVVLAESTYRHIRGVFDVEPRGALTVTGKTEPVEIYLLDRAKPRAFRMPIRGVGNIETRTIGRERELGVLQDTYREAVGKSRTRVALVTGEAGIGKSRLLYEFEKWLELLPEGILFFEAQAVPETSRRPNGVFRDLLTFRFEIRDSDTIRRVQQKFRKGFADCLEPPRADVVGHWLGFDFSASDAVTGLLGSRSFSQQARADLCHAFRTLSREPMVLFLEDLHWSDQSSLELLEHIAAEVPDGKLMFVCLARPALFDRRPNWGGESEAFVRLALEPLTDTQSRDLVEEILQRVDDVPDELREMVVTGAHGNPFYAEELVLLLIDRGAIVVGEDRWHVDRDKLASVAVPDTLEGILRARLDCLPSKERLVLQCASVVGRQFWGAAVSELSQGAGSSGAPGLLEVARERQLVFPAKSSSFEDSEEFSFKHALLRDIVYETVVKGMRRAYHAGVARWLERNVKDRTTEYLLVIADHYEAAGDSGNAAAYLVRAGDEMVKTSALKEAVATYERALYLLPKNRPHLQAVLLTGLGDVCRILGDHAAARRCLEEAIGIARKINDSKSEVKALNALARTAMVQGQYTEAKPYLAEALKLASRKGFQEGAAQVLLNLADVSFRLGDADTAMDSGMQSLRIAKELKNAQAIAGAHRVLGFASMMRGDLEAAAHHHDEGLEIFRSIGDRWGVGTCLINLGEVHRKMGKVDAAVSYWEKSLPIAREIGARLSVAIGHVNMGGALAGREGDEERAMKNLREALREAMAIGAVPIALEGIVSVAIIYAREGRQPLAARLLGAVMTHPSFNAEIQAYSEPLVRKLRRKLGSETLQSLMDQGRGQDLDVLVAEITSESPLGRPV